MPYYVRTIECEPAQQFGYVIDRTPYTTRGEACEVRDRCITEEMEARARGERARRWYLFDIQDVRPERPVNVESIGVGRAGEEARRWANEKRRESAPPRDEKEG